MEGKMKLSEAVRVGAMLRPQGVGAYFTKRYFVSPENNFGEGECTRSCALGAAYEATFGQTDVTVDPGQDGAMRKAYPVLNRRIGVVDLHLWITNLNDREGWTRTQIADYVAIIEDYAEQMDNAPFSQSAALAA